MAKQKWPGWLTRHRFTERAYRPYVIAIGQLALAWSDLHERLATMFWIFTGGGFTDRPTAMWNSSNFDRPRRAMLQAVVSTIPQSEQDKFPKLIEDMNWVSKRQRNWKMPEMTQYMHHFIYLGRPMR
jgi:hypothetical protein